MLINFRFKNTRSFYEENNLSLEATKDDDLKGINTFTAEECGLLQNENELLKSAIIFGGNASGKTNVLKALAYMKNAVGYSMSEKPIIGSHTPFYFYNDAFKEESLFEVEFVQNKTYYKYGFTIKNGIITKEWLDKRQKKIVNIFTRTNNNLKLSGQTESLKKLVKLNEDTLFLSIAKNFQFDFENAIDDVLSWFKNLLIVFDNMANSLDFYSREDGKYKQQALKILKLADIGISDIDVKKDKIANIKQDLTPEILNAGQLKLENEDIYNIDLITTFNVYNKDKECVGKKDIMLFKDRGFNSEGTERLLCYLGAILIALDKGATILIDEIDSKLHFLVADYILKLFNSIDKNPNNAQLICTAHNLMLMDEDLRRDQIYFTSKDKYGSSKLVSLSDFTNVRKNDLFSKKYLAGFYSKLPDMR